ncbi:MAG: penicillin-binding protein 1A [Beijerinckiaceae bacterium]
MRHVVRLLGSLFGIGAMVFILGAAVAGFFVWKSARDLPDYTQLANYEPPVTTRVHAGDGALIAEYYKERRLYLPIQAVPKIMIAAFLSAEDKNFYSHIGIDPEGIGRALVQAASGKGGRQQGASTITQQVAKNFLLTNERTYERKIKEMLTALRIESAYSKDRILELYLNEIYLGLGNYGVAAAALNMFGKSVHELGLHEVAYLAALPKAPGNYDPFKNRDAALARRNWVIERMVANGYVKAADAAVAKQQPLGVAVRTLTPNSFAAGYFAEEVRRELAERYGFKKLLEGGLSVRTTLDPQMQAMARKALVDGLVRFDEARGWRGADKQLQFGAREWGLALAELPSWTDIQPWRYAVVLEVGAQSARVGLQPQKDNKTGEIPRTRETKTLAMDGVRWTRRANMTQVVQPGDIIFVEPMADKPDQVRLRQFPEVSGALVAMDPWTGRVKAMVGGFSYDQSEFNRATQAQRQPGSSFKPLVYATALDNGYTPSSIIMDSPIEIDQGNGEVWRPENYGGGEGAGPKTLRNGIEKSRNMMTVRLAQDLGMPLVAEYSRRFGVYDDLMPVLSMSLGAGETTVMRMVTGYSMLANGGRRVKPTLIDRIQDRWGKTIFKHDDRQCETCADQKWADQNEPRLRDNRELVIDPMSAYQITSIMQGVIQRGTAAGIKAELGRQYVAGKTGTTNDSKDVWFVGYSANLAVGVYMGYDRPRSLGDSATAGQYAAPIFRDFMKAALRGQPDTPFKIPAGMKLIRVSAGTGLRASGGDAIMEAFKPGTAPPDSYNFGVAGGGGGGGGGGSVGTGTGGL